MVLARFNAARRRRRSISVIAAVFAVVIATLTLSVQPSSATSYAELWSVPKQVNYGLVCNPGNDPHTFLSGGWDPISYVYNGCSTRVWFHESYNSPGHWSGWSWCISPGAGSNIPLQYQSTADAYVSSNTAHC
jgi:hypothetical protein